MVRTIYIPLGLILLFLTACSPHIRAFTNSEIHSPLKSYKTFAVILDPKQDGVVDRKIALLLENQMMLLGYKKSSPDSADLHIAFAQQVVDAGVRTLVVPNFAYIPGTYTYYSSGASAYTEGTTVYTGSSARSVKNYKKVLTVIIVDRDKTEHNGRLEKVWEAQTQEEGWCNKILATAPHIISAMFHNFGASVTNRKEILWASDEGASGVMGTKPYDLDC